MSGEDTPKKHRNLKDPWKKGQSGNPAGRPRGAKSKLSEDFFNDMVEAWETAGKSALERMAAADPSKFVAVVANLMPKEFKSESETTHYIVSESPVTEDEWKDEFVVEPTERASTSTH